MVCDQVCGFKMCPWLLWGNGTVHTEAGHHQKDGEEPDAFHTVPLRTTVGESDCWEFWGILLEPEILKLLRPLNDKVVFLSYIA